MRLHVRYAQHVGFACNRSLSNRFYDCALVCRGTSWRHFLQLRHQRGSATKNVLILGPNHLGNVLRKQITQQDHLGRNFKGFIPTGPGVAHHEAGGFVIGELRAMA